MRDEVASPTPVAFENHLRVAGGAELVPVALQLTAQLPEVIDLAIEGDAQRAGRIEHRLMAAGREINDRQPPVRKADGPVCRVPVPGIVGPAVPEAIAHADEVGRRPGTRRDDAKDAAHQPVEGLSIGMPSRSGYSAAHPQQT